MGKGSTSLARLGVFALAEWRADGWAGRVVERALDPLDRPGLAWPERGRELTGRAG